MQETQGIPFWVTFFFIIFPIASLGLMTARYFRLKDKYR